MSKVSLVKVVCDYCNEYSIDGSMNVVKIHGKDACPECLAHIGRSSALAETSGIFNMSGDKGSFAWAWSRAMIHLSTFAMVVRVSLRQVMRVEEAVLILKLTSKGETSADIPIPSLFLWTSENINSSDRHRPVRYLPKDIGRDTDWFEVDSSSSCHDDLLLKGIQEPEEFRRKVLKMAEVPTMGQHLYRDNY